MTEQSTTPSAAQASVTPFLMFEGEGGAAMDFYVEAFSPHLPAGVTRRDLRDDSHPETKDSPDLIGTVLHGEISLAGQHLRIFDSPPGHEFSFTPSISLFVDLPSTCTAEELDELADTLSAGGHPLMPPGDYGFSRRFAWVADRWGVTWQLNLA
ncbi:VOC family protein [Micrococcus terreus]|uniref:Glyoxalase superfamily enzyme, possibly 3-demethylubiquinone-9 3-methyltransferase n=1 Tax=Micrococcus terreus TaxID=574650 RepID=A0A1I7MRQ3_9MICC|nr:VOC family protein [Micrococcus terreus]SFV24600.1 Glyoxalase superfamily enzyme, possibly 3-demethylubiquinone-9 3-methyltransferase [Micrococcus terreus]